MGTRQRKPTVTRSTILIAAVALAACSGGGSGTNKHRTTTTTTSSSTTTTAAPTTTGVGSSTCLVGQLAVTLTPGSPGAGQRYATVTFTNNGTRACTMFGYIGMQLLGAGSSPIPTNVVRDTDQPKTTVTLAPGGKSFTTLHWAGIPVGSEGNPCEPVPQQVQITPPNETHFLVAPWTQDSVCGHGTIDTEPVRPGAGV
jgi:hypothetical protein